MAEFCNQCARSLDMDRGDFKGLTSEKDWKEGKAARVLCEGCGETQVDPDGYCIGGCWGPYQESGVHHISPRNPAYKGWGAP